MDSKQLFKNLFELTKLDFEDLKNVNFASLFKDVLVRKDILINFAAIIIAFLASVIIFFSGNSKHKQLKDSVFVLEKKLASYNEFKQAQKDLLTYLKNAPKPVPEDKFINFLNENAFRHHIQITSYSPAKNVRAAFYESTQMRIDITAQSYPDLWEFIHTIENSEYAIRIDSWNARQLTKTGRQAKTMRREKEVIQAEIQIATILVKK